MCRKKSLEVQSLLYSNLLLSLQDSMCICQFHSTSLRSRVLYACVTLLHECTRLLHSICMRGRGRVCTRFIVTRSSWFRMEIRKSYVRLTSLIFHTTLPFRILIINFTLLLNFFPFRICTFIVIVYCSRCINEQSRLFL